MAYQHSRGSDRPGMYTIFIPYMGNKGNLDFCMLFGINKSRHQISNGNIMLTYRLKIVNIIFDK